MIGFVGYTFCVCFILAATQILNASNHTREKRISTRSINEELKECAKVIGKKVKEVGGEIAKEVEEIPKEYELNEEEAIEVKDPELKRLKNKVLKDLTLNQSEIINIERRTIGQYRNKEWLEKQKNRIPDVHFGWICLRRPGDDMIPVVEHIMYYEIPMSRPLRHSRAYATIAIEDISKEARIEVKPNGLFIDPEMPYLVASPDGLVGDDGIVEIKFPYQRRHSTPLDSFRANKLRFIRHNQKIYGYELYRLSAYYYQVQGQLHITRRKYCYFVVWTTKGIFYEKIYRDDDFWKEKMEKQLSSFFMDYMVPEIVSPRHKPKVHSLNK